MGNQVSRPMSSMAAVYPPDDPSARELIERVATADRDENGNAVLRRSLTAVERQVLQKRAATLAPYIDRARLRDAEAAVLAMVIGRGTAAGMGEDEADVFAAQCASVLVGYGLPLWAIQRACLRFAAGDVRAEDVGEKHLSNTYVPSSAHVRILTERIARAVHVEVHKIGTTLRGVVEPPQMTELERIAALPKIMAMRESYHREAAAIAVEEITAEEVRRAAGRRAAAEASTRMILAEYRRARVEPVYLDAGKTIPVSLETLRRQGWRIEEVGPGESALVAPARSA